jgi:uncharacterized membrane protein (UPF0127 family)
MQTVQPTLTLIWLLLACQTHTLTPAQGKEVAGGSDAGLPRARVALEGPGGPATFDVEIANDDASRERGLMFRTAVPAGTGMLFLFPEVSQHTFWMKNTLIPLDMVFIGPDRRVVGIVENAAPRTLSPRTPGVPSQAVLEVAGGTAFSLGWKPGTLVTYEGVPAPK